MKVYKAYVETGIEEQGELISSQIPQLLKEAADSIMITVWGSAVQMKILSRLAMLGSHFGIVMSAMGKRLFQAIEDWDALELIIGDDQERKHHLKMNTT